MERIIWNPELSGVSFFFFFFGHAQRGEWTFSFETSADFTFPSKSCLYHTIVQSLTKMAEASYQVEWESIIRFCSSERAFLELWWSDWWSDLVFLSDWAFLERYIQWQWWQRRRLVPGRPGSMFKSFKIIAKCVHNCKKVSYPSEATLEQNSRCERKV